MKPTILVSCASSIATSTVVASNIREILEERNYAVNVVQCSFSEIESKLETVRPILILVTGAVRKYDDIPVIVATPFLTGIGKDKIIEQVIEIVEKNLPNN
ncbi:PTS sugar transporter subunit IIB [Paratissierella segnis]|jgi:PTS system galactitol-specific IIB component|uniref:PTS sugar transporter subunit IIB n=1 Tax=Paratissierella segnis TaxID=2763679 RepID=A0A926IKS6_9FIRM|nr:PTS sugar transporter subunit IIB [Paratissierella segnis]MBC8587983.1 PTS sugar transporter subunit IIB [Paratissierella segnis]